MCVAYLFCPFRQLQEHPQEIHQACERGAVLDCASPAQTEESAYSCWQLQNGTSPRENVPDTKKAG